MPSTSACTPSWVAPSPDPTPGPPASEQAGSAPAPLHHGGEELVIASDEHRPPEVLVDEDAPAPPQFGAEPCVRHEPVEHRLELGVGGEPQPPARALAVLPGRPAGTVHQDRQLLDPS